MAAAEALKRAGEESIKPGNKNARSNGNSLLLLVLGILLAAEPQSNGGTQRHISKQYIEDQRRSEGACRRCTVGAGSGDRWLRCGCYVENNELGGFGLPLLKRKIV